MIFRFLFAQIFHGQNQIYCDDLYLVECVLYQHTSYWSINATRRGKNEIKTTHNGVMGDACISMLASTLSGDAGGGGGGGPSQKWPRDLGIW